MDKQNFSFAGLLSRALSALLLLVGIAIGARVIWSLFTPLLPYLAAVVVVLLVYRLLLWRRWR